MPKCVTCNDRGRANGCPVCFKVSVKVPRPKKKKKLTAAERIAEEEAKIQAKRDEIKVLWEHANMAKWLDNRRKYMELLAEIKRKEALLLR